MNLFSDWTHAEIIQILGIIVGALAPIYGWYITRKIKEIHILINSRMQAMLDGAHAQGQLAAQKVIDKIADKVADKVVDKVAEQSTKN
ncbi:MAG TPA: hypothetical protein VEP90_08515 [Methylomirabilota bacterium]|nr:hypothetical protein [Methylomirabilota bacterium]